MDYKYKALTTMLICVVVSLNSFGQFYSINVSPSSGIYSVYADSVTNRLFFGGPITTCNGSNFPGTGYYDLINLNYDTLKDSRLQWGCDIRNIKRIDSVLYFMGSIGYSKQNNQIQSTGIIESDGDTINYNITYNSNHECSDIIKVNNKFFVAGLFSVIGNINASSISKFENGIWSAFPSLGNSPNVTSMVYFNNELYIGGNIDSPLNDICKFDGSNWVQLGTGLTGGFTVINKMIEFNGKLIVGGLMQSANGDPGDGVAAWDGAQWTPMSNNLYGQVFDMAIYNGELYAAGAINLTTDTASFIGLVKWDGNTWITVDSAYFDGSIHSLSVLGGSMFIGGFFEHINGAPFLNLAEYKKPVGVKEIVEYPSFNVIPNLISTSARIEFNTPLNSNSNIIKLYDITGKELQQIKIEKGTNRINLSLEKYKNGYYLLALYAEGVNHGSRKLLKIE